MFVYIHGGGELEDNSGNIWMKIKYWQTPKLGHFQCLYSSWQALGKLSLEYPQAQNWWESAPQMRFLTTAICAEKCVFMSNHMKHPIFFDCTPQLWPWSFSLPPNRNIRHLWIQILYQSHLKMRIGDINFNNMLLKPKYQVLSVNSNLISFKRAINILKSKLFLTFFLIVSKVQLLWTQAACSSRKGFKR